MSVWFQEVLTVQKVFMKWVQEIKTRDFELDIWKLLLHEAYQVLLFHKFEDADLVKDKKKHVNLMNGWHITLLVI